MIRTTFALTLLVFSGTTTRAGFIDFQADLNKPSNVSFGVDGALSGTITLGTIKGFDTARGAGSTLTVANGLITFALFGQHAVGPNDFFYTGGTLALTGSINGGPSQTLLSGNLVSGLVMESAEPSIPRGWILSGPNPFFGAMADDVASTFGPGLGRGQMTLWITQATPGGVVVPIVSHFTFNTPAVSVPEPGSMVLVGLGLGLVGCWGAPKWRPRTAPRMP